MFVSNLEGKENERVTVIGQFLRITDSHVILKVDNKEMPIEHKSLDSYKTKFVMVTGIVVNKVLVEESSHPIEDDFDHVNYARLVKLNVRYAPVF